MQCGFAARYDVCSTARIIPCRTVTGLRRVSNSKKKKTKNKKNLLLLACLGAACQTAILLLYTVNNYNHVQSTIVVLKQLHYRVGVLCCK